MPLARTNVRFWGVKRTSRFGAVMFAFDPKRTSAKKGPPINSKGATYFRLLWENLAHFDFYFASAAKLRIKFAWPGTTQGTRRAASALYSWSWGLPIRSFHQCVTTAFKTSGRGLRRLATNSPHVTSVLARAGSLRRKMLESRFAYFLEPSSRFPAR